MNRIGLSTLPLCSAPAPVRGDAFQAALDEMLEPGCATAELKSELLGVLRSYRPEQVERLREAGYRFRYKCLPDNIGGVQNGYQKTIDLNPSWPAVQRRRAALHEIAHGLDFLQKQARLGRVGRFLSRFHQPFASQSDARLEHLYRGYLERTRTDQREPDPWLTWARGAGPRALGTIAAVGASLATGLVPVAAGAALVGVFLTGKKLAETVFAARETSRFAAPRQARSDAEAATFSPYAARAHKSYEYLAEGVAFYLNSPEERALLRQRDPALHNYVHDWYLA